MRKATLLVSAAFAIFVAIQAPAQTFNLLHSFNPGPGIFPTGYLPGGPLVLSGNTLYGASQNGGASGDGVIFAVNTDGSGFTTLYAFTNGYGPRPASLLLSGNTLYGTTFAGGSSGDGTVFKVSTDGSGFAVLHSFSASSDGSEPAASLALSGNTLYGTAWTDGAQGFGTIFAVNTDGTGFTNLHSFTSIEAANPNGVVLSDNRLYGTTSGLGSGTVFAINTDGTGFEVLHNFTPPGVNGVNPDGSLPMAALTLSGGTLYGTAASGGRIEQRHCLRHQHGREWLHELVQPPRR